MPRGKGKIVRALGLRTKGYKEAYPGTWRAYISWMAMWNRVYPKKEKIQDLTYKNKKITICERWYYFWNFFEDMGERPEGMELDRTNNNGNYEPGNCRWTTRLVNVANSDQNHWVSYGGAKRNCSEWSRLLGGGLSLVANRISSGWSEERAVSTPVGKHTWRNK